MVLTKTEKAVFNKLKAKMNKDDTKKRNPFDTLNKFMEGVGYKHLKTTEGTYTKANGKTMKIKKAHFDNGKTYCIGTSRYWLEG